MLKTQVSVTKISHSSLVEKGAHWLKVTASNIRYRSPFVVTEFDCAGINEIPDVFGLNPDRHVLIEVKTSRADFKQDFKKRARQEYVSKIGNYRFYLAPTNLIKVSELPDKWGLLEWNGKTIKIIHNPVYIPSEGNGVEFIYNSILRRKHKYQIFNFRK